MSSCQMKKGIFVQRACNRPTTVQCTQCQTPVCNHHYKQSEQGTLCFSCYASQNQEGEVEAEENVMVHHYHWWYWNTRSHYHSTYHDDYVTFDESDYEGFNTHDGDSYDRMDQDDDFFDS